MKKPIMQNMRIVGLAIMVIAILFFFVGFYYISSAENALLQGHTVSENGTCSHADDSICPFAELNKLAVPKYLGLFVDLLLFALGVFLFAQKKPVEKSVARAKEVLKVLEGEEAQIASILIDSQGMIFQN